MNFLSAGLLLTFYILVPGVWSLDNIFLDLETKIYYKAESGI